MTVLEAPFRLPEACATRASSNHLACLRWCRFVEARREHRIVYNRIADKRVAKLLDLAQALLADNAEHVAACGRIES
jgi:ArsR family transcriptional regulator, cadmium/lead-responsive transcriptional repressor